jgi:hypothetical protein
MNGHAPKFRCKVDLNAQGEIKCDVFDAKKERLRDEITEGLYSKCTVKAICAWRSRGPSSPSSRRWRRVHRPNLQTFSQTPAKEYQKLG